MNAGNITYSTLTGIIGTTTLLTASTTNTTNIGFSTGSGLYLITNGLTVNTSIVTSTLNGINKQSHPNEGFKQPQGPLRSMGRDVPFTMGTLGAG